MNWKKGINKYKKLNKTMNTTPVILYTTFFLFILANALFMVAHHNLDLLSNYALIYSQINEEYNCDENFINIRDITDCNVYNDCPDYKSIYLMSQHIWIYSILFYNLAIITMGIHLIVKWKK